MKNSFKDDNAPRKPPGKVSVAERLEIERAKLWSLHIKSGGASGDPRYFDGGKWLRNRDRKAADREEWQRISQGRAERCKQEARRHPSKQLPLEAQRNRDNPFLSGSVGAPLPRKQARNKVPERDR